MDSSYSLKGLQILLSQILHDLISPFSALSAGLDLPLKDRNEMESFMQEAKKRLHLQLILFRFIFSDSEGSMGEAIKIVQSYAQLSGIEVSGESQLLPKIFVLSAFWLCNW